MTGYYAQVKERGNYITNPNMSWVEGIVEKMIEEAIKETGETKEVYLARMRADREEKERIYNETYYTPTIDELFYGYVCERQTSWGYVKGKWPEVLSSDTHYNLFASGNTPHDKVFNDSHWLRATYLTREQVEEEGWVKSGAVRDGGSLLFSKDDKYILTAFHPKNKRRISIRMVQDDLKLKLYFDGECKSINEFRKILKFLNIS